jgi:hypothetical protein
VRAAARAPVKVNGRNVKQVGTRPAAKATARPAKAAPKQKR